MHPNGEQLLTVSPSRARNAEPDEICVQAVDLARAAAVEMAGPGYVGEHVGTDADADRVVTHMFVCLDPAYHGWRWAVTLTRASRAKTATVAESVLLPGPESILAPEWVPWRERLRPGDLGVGDILLTAADDERLVPAVLLAGDDGLADIGDLSVIVATLAEPFAGNPAVAAGLVPPQGRVLSSAGRDDTGMRWYASEHGPKSPLAHAAPGVCAGCGFFVRLGGPLGQVFGVCANAYAPDDGRVVSVDHGCGAHSESVFPPGVDQPLRPVIDELGYDLVDLPGVSVDETLFEPLDHG
jgi:hypothetical protein